MKKVKKIIAVLATVITAMSVSAASTFAEDKEIIAEFYNVTIVVKNMDTQQCNEMYEKGEQYYLDNCVCLDEFYKSSINVEKGDNLVLRHVFCYPDRNSTIINEWSYPDKWEQENGKIRWHQTGVKIIWDELYSKKDYSIDELNKYFEENGISAVVQEKTDSDIESYGDYKYVLKKKSDFEKTPVQALMKMIQEFDFSYIYEVPVCSEGTIVYGNDGSSAEPTETTTTPLATAPVETTTTTVTSTEAEPQQTTASSTTVPAGTTSTSITTVVTDVPKIVLGDADGNNELNVRDCAAIASALASGKGEELPGTADYNRDGKKDVRDAAAISKDLARK